MSAFVTATVLSVLLTACVADNQQNSGTTTTATIRYLKDQLPCVKRSVQVCAQMCKNRIVDLSESQKNAALQCQSQFIQNQSAVIDFYADCMTKKGYDTCERYAEPPRIFSVPLVDANAPPPQNKLLPASDCLKSCMATRKASCETGCQNPDTARNAARGSCIGQILVAGQFTNNIRNMQTCVKNIFA